MAKRIESEDQKMAVRANRVGSLRKALNLTQQEIGDVMGLSSSAVSQRLRGQIPFKAQELEKLASFANTDVGWFER
ncbi:helix-turn-helix transcriptional regulator [Bifidobacterium sp. W8108]|uniref:helix-turn-helix domain-containing protein n=1 Tax=unclassified Bifidobacterium TaxID=2608897 RepID=UPI0018DE7980|nr:MULTISPECIES: helix-turn-helix transcriptional regulator [unclassified Bifidobacterium]MBH9979446.1 helix-turn-helix transcriptional regulator [Bifidobacterium sp. W8108]MBI0174148.1 helix-turn-helix transcriptional regulator [Bifidobacterium sp. M0307]